MNLYVSTLAATAASAIVDTCDILGFNRQGSPIIGASPLYSSRQVSNALRTTNEYINAWMPGQELDATVEGNRS